MRERDDVTAERNNEAVKEVYWYSAEIVFSKLGFHLGCLFLFFYRMELEFSKLEFHLGYFFYRMELEFRKLEFHVFFFFFFKSDIIFMLVGAGAGKLIFLAGTRV